MIHSNLNPSAAAKASRAKAHLENLAAEIRRDTGKPRALAMREALRENPELRRDLVCAHNRAHGRVRQAEAFARDFDQAN